MIVDFKVLMFAHFDYDDSTYFLTEGNNYIDADIDYDRLLRNNLSSFKKYILQYLDEYTCRNIGVDSYFDEIILEKINRNISDLFLESCDLEELTNEEWMVLFESAIKVGGLVSIYNKTMCL